MLKKLQPVEKRGGARRAIKKKPPPPPENSIFKISSAKSTGGILQKPLHKYKFLICTDLAPDSVSALVLFAAWLDCNQKLFEDHEHFPFYGFLVDEYPETRIKVQRMRELLTAITKYLGWDSKELVQFQKQYQTAGSRVWADTDTGLNVNTTENEKSLIFYQDTQTVDGYPEADPFVHNIKSIMTTKAANLFILYLKPVNFIKTLEKNPECLSYFRNIPGSMFVDRTQIDQGMSSFITRGRNEGHMFLSSTETIFGTANEGNNNNRNLYLTPGNSQKFFDILGGFNDSENSVPGIMKKCMIVWANDCKNKYTDEQLEEMCASDYPSLCNEYGGNVLHVQDQLCVMAMLKAAGVLALPEISIVRDSKGENTFNFYLQPNKAISIIEKVHFTAMKMFQ